MKIQERTGAGNHRSNAPAQPGMGERLPTAPRERKPALAALAVLLILIGALGATILVMRAGDRIEVVKVTQPISAGEKVTKDKVSSVMVAKDDSIHYVKWSQLGSLTKLKARDSIPAGVLAVGELFTGDDGLTAGKASVGLSLKDGQYPNDLKPGDKVAAYRVATRRRPAATRATRRTTGNVGQHCAHRRGRRGRDRGRHERLDHRQRKPPRHPGRQQRPGRRPRERRRRRPGRSRAHTESS